MKPLGRMQGWVSWTLALAILVWLLARTSLPELAQATRGARLDRFLILVATACGLWLILESASLWTILRRLHRDTVRASLSWGTILSARGRSYLLTPIHWNLGRAGFVLRLERTHGVPVLETSSALLLQQSVDIWLFAGCAWLGLSSLPASTRTLVLGRSVAAVFLALSGLLLLLVAPAPRWALLEWIRRSRLASAFRCTRPIDLLLVGLLRGVHCGVFVAVYAWGTAAFGLDLPPAILLAGVPLIQTVGTLPITPAGLGTQQAMMLVVFSPHGPRSAILAFGLAFPLLQTFVRFGIGLVSLFLAPPAPFRIEPVRNTRIGVGKDDPGASISPRAHARNAPPTPDGGPPPRLHHGAPAGPDRGARSRAGRVAGRLPPRSGDSRGSDAS